MESSTGAQLVAQILRDLGVRVVFGIVGIPVVEIAEEALNLGIRFIGMRNEQAASYAASIYGYLTGRPGVCLVVGGPGVLHAIAGIGNSSVNGFPLLLLAGSSEAHLVTKGAFQELDAIALLTPHTKLSVRPPGLEFIPNALRTAFRHAWHGRPGTGFVDLPADLIQGTFVSSRMPQIADSLATSPKGGIESEKLSKVIQLLKTAKAPLVVIGKGAAYARAEGPIRQFIDKTVTPFLSTPMGKGVVGDSHPQNVSSARSVALKHADIILLLGARLNWILHFGEPPKWNPGARFIQIDIHAEELGRNGGSGDLGIVGDVSIIMQQLVDAVDGWRWNPAASDYSNLLEASMSKNKIGAMKKATENRLPMTYGCAFGIIKNTLHRLLPAAEGGIVYVSEGAKTMDISRSVFPVEHPRLRLDAGTFATMGVGLGYAIAAHAAYNFPSPQASSGPSSRRKKVVAIEGDSAFGFSAMEIETMARYGMDILIFVINNSGIYHGDSNSADDWVKMQQATVDGSNNNGLRSTSLGWEVRYDKIADACGGQGFLVHTPEELERATTEGFHAKVPIVVNVIIEAGAGRKVEFGWQSSVPKPTKQPKL